MISRCFARLRMPGVLVALLLASAVPTIAESAYLPSNHPDGIHLLPAPPDPASPEGKAELASVRSVVHERTSEEKARAQKDSTLSFSLFESAIGPAFDLEKLPKTDALLQKVKKEIGDIIDTPKNHFQRLRPYQLDESLSLGKPEPSFGYPSGHSTRGTVYAMVIAELYPGQKEAILQIGRNIGWDRVIIGKHFPSDIYAGRVLGQAIAQELLQSPSFKQDLASARAEIAAINIASAPQTGGPKGAPARVAEPAAAR